MKLFPKTRQSIMKPFVKMAADLKTYIKDQEDQFHSKLKEANMLKIEANSHRQEVTLAQADLENIEKLVPTTK